MPWKLPNAVLIYTLSDPRTGDVRYVGKTIKNLKDRLNLHLWYAKKGNKTHRCNWVRLLFSLGLSPVISEIERIDLRKEWAERERYWIAFYKSNGADLTNAADGGEGMHGHRHTAEEKAKISAKNRGRVITQEWRDKISMANKGRIHSPEARKKVSEAGKGRRASEQTLVRMSLAQKKAQAGKHAGEKNIKAKLTYDQAAEIRGSLMPLSFIMSQYHISKTQASRVRRGEQWK